MITVMSIITCSLWEV